MQEWAAVQKLHKCKVPILQIAKQLKMSRNTVKKLLKLKEEPKYKRADYPSKMEPYMEEIAKWRTEEDFNGTRIYRELKKLGYTGSINPIYRTLKVIDEIKTEISPKATERIETPVGDQAQFDWSPYDMSIGSRIRTVYCFTMILAASRRKAICFSLTSDGDAIYEAIQELYEDLGGVTLELLIDNPKALVIDNKSDPDEPVNFNTKALLLAAHLGVELNACNTQWARTKGKIEKPYQYIEEQFIKGNKFDTMTALNRAGKDFINEWNQEVHGTTRRIPQEFFETEEIKALLPLPGNHLYLKPRLKRTVSNDSYIHILTNKYSVPVKYATRLIHYRIIYGFRIDIFDENKHYIMSSEIGEGRHNTFKKDEHYAEIATKVNKSIPQIKRLFTQTFQNGEQYLKAAGIQFQQPSFHARRILELTDLYTVEALDKILAYAIEHGGMDIKGIKRLLKEKYVDIVINATTCVAPPEDDDRGLTRDCTYYETESEVTELWETQH